MSEQITITNVKNANELDSFVPVSGNWFWDGNRESANSVGSIVESIINYMDADYNLKVDIFTSNGQSIHTDVPACGEFLVTRI